MFKAKTLIPTTFASSRKTGIIKNFSIIDSDQLLIKRPANLMIHNFENKTLQFNSDNNHGTPAKSVDHDELLDLRPDLLARSEVDRKRGTSQEQAPKTGP